MLLSTADKLESFLKQFPDFPNAFLVGSPTDIFVTELADQVIKRYTLLKFYSQEEDRSLLDCILYSRHLGHDTNLQMFSFLC